MAELEEEIAAGGAFRDIVTKTSPSVDAILPGISSSTRWTPHPASRPTRR